MKITKDTSVTTLRKAMEDLGYIVKDSDKQIQFILNEIVTDTDIKFSFDKDGKTITGYKYIGIQRLEGTRESRRRTKLE